jgi:hypothetical protein
MAKKNTKRAQLTAEVATKAVAKAAKLDVVAVTSKAKELFEELDAVSIAVTATKQRLDELLSKEQVALSLDDLRQELEDKKVERDREQEKYDYELARTRTEQEDERSDALEIRSAELFELESQLSKDKEANAAILAKEATFEDRVKADVAKQVGAITRDMKHTSELAEAKHGAEVTILKAEVASATGLAINLQAQVTSLQAQLDKARQDVVATAQSAVSGASAAKAQAEILANLGQLRQSGRDSK